MKRLSPGLAAVLLLSVVSAHPARAQNGVPSSTDEQAIIKVIADRQAAWNAGDEPGYARLLTPDADIVSSSGRDARGRDAVIRLYSEQRIGVFAGATTSTRVSRIRTVAANVALVDVNVELSGLENATQPRRSTTIFVVVKQPDGRWLITAQRAGPQAAAR